MHVGKKSPSVSVVEQRRKDGVVVEVPVERRTLPKFKKRDFGTSARSKPKKKRQKLKRMADCKRRKRQSSRQPALDAAKPRGFTHQPGNRGGSWDVVDNALATADAFEGNTSGWWRSK